MQPPTQPITIPITSGSYAISHPDGVDEYTDLLGTWTPPAGHVDPRTQDMYRVIRTLVNDVRRYRDALLTSKDECDVLRDELRILVDDWE